MGEGRGDEGFFVWGSVCEKEGRRGGKGWGGGRFVNGQKKKIKYSYSSNDD